MKRATAFFLLFLILLAACQPTPETEVVTPKDYDALIEKAKASPETIHVTLAPEGESYPPPANLPESDSSSRIRMEFYGNTEAFHVIVDAEVIRPEGPFPIMEVTPGDFDDESAQSFFDVLTEGFTLYTAEELETKASLEKEILEMQQFIDDGLPGFDGTASQKKEQIKYWQKELDELKQRYLTARDEPGAPATKVQITWREPAKYDTQTAGSFVVRSVDQKRGFTVQTNAQGAHGKRKFDSKRAGVGFFNEAVLPEGIIYIFRDAGEVKDLDAAPLDSTLKIAPRKALQQAEELVQRIGVEGLSFYDVRLEKAEERVHDGGEWVTGTPCSLYNVRFLRRINGIPVIYPEYYSSSGDEAEPRPSWNYERLEVKFNDTGLYSFSYSGPLVVGKPVVESAALMPFDAVMERFDQMVRVKYEGILKDPDRDNIQSMEVQVDRIELSLERVAQPDNINGGLLVPVWSFYGAILCTRSNDSFDYVYNHAMPFLTLNAVDGNLIDPMKGY